MNSIAKVKQAITIANTSIAEGWLFPGADIDGEKRGKNTDVNLEKVKAKVKDAFK